MSARPVYIVSAKRTIVAPRGGALSHLQADELLAPVIEALLAETGVGAETVDQVLMGNALYAGGNPARMGALRAGLPDMVPAMTLDTQCCAGLDAIIMASHMIAGGAAECIVAGGMESFSRSPLRMHRPMAKGQEPVPYDRPAFSPFPDHDPNLTHAAAELAGAQMISRERQADFACHSHDRARQAQGSGRLRDELVAIQGVSQAQDSFTRSLKRPVALRAPVLAGDDHHGVSASTIAVEADGAAAVMLVSEDLLKAGHIKGAHSISSPVRVLASAQCGGAPDQPALVPIAAIRSASEKIGLLPKDLDLVELMEAYASQALVTVDEMGFREDQVNVGGGALARGHPTGASGAILCVRMVSELKAGKRARGLCAIAGAGGLGSALILGFNDN